MEFLKYRSIDIYRYTFPGLWISIDLYFFKSTIILPSQALISIVSNLDLKQFILLLFISYIVGFCIDPIGKIIRLKIAQKIWKTPTRKDDGLQYNDSERYTLTKHYTDGNFAMIETWDLLKGMAANFALAAMFTFLLSIYKIFYLSYPSNYEWIWLCFFSILIFFSMLYQSHNFEKFSVEDLNAVMKNIVCKEGKK